jgi:hypothetical protein
MKKLLLSILFVALTLIGTPSSVFATGFENDPYVYLNSVDNPSTVEQIKAELTVFDVEDGDLTASIYIVSDNYTGNEDVLGDFVVVYGVTDSGGTEVTQAIIVRNVDIIAPEFVIDVPSTLRIPQYSYLPSNLPQIKAIDSFEGDITSEVTITGLDLIDTEILGTYNLIYSVSDSSGNQTSETFVVYVVDSIAPELTGPTSIIKRSNIILDGQFYLEYYSAIDDHDGIVTNRIDVVNDNYLGNASKPGTYTVVVTVADTEGNYTNQTLTIIVVDDMLPRLIIDKYYWVVDNNYKFTDDNFINTLRFQDDLPNLTYIFTTTYDNYSNSYNNLGTYQKNFSLRSSSGEEFTREVILEVVESSANIVDENPSFIESYWKQITGGIVGVVAIAVVVIGIKNG